MAERRTSSRASGGAKKAGASRAKSSTSSAKRTAAAKKGGAARGREQRARKTARTTARAATKPAKAAGVEAKTVAEFRDALRKNLIKPSGMVMLTRERIEEALEKSGKLSPKDARGIASDLLKRGRKETDDVLKDLENLLEKGRRDLGKRTASARRQAKGAQRRAVHAASPALAQADRARRAAKVGSNFPITLYEELNVAEIKSRLADLTPAELRKVRDHERRNANRKGVLTAIESKLS
jgi:polyhydroxyalkanoate synthesis regulator phasin